MIIMNSSARNEANLAKSPNGRNKNENIEQAIERAGTKAGNKGYDCALSAIEMVNLIKEFEA